MATYKRRIIYLSDEQWAALLEASAVRRQTVSSLVRDGLRGLWTDPRDADTTREAVPPDPSPAARRMTQAECDAVLRKVNKGGRGAA